MQDLSNPEALKQILKGAGFSFKKSLGQNFLINPEVCPAMAKAACGSGDVGVLEIGPGVGVLTAELAKSARKVVSIELDERLKPVLQKTLAPYPNTEIVFGDAMKLDLPALLREKFSGMETVVCANLPYYITSPLVMLLLEGRLPVRSITVMVQKEAAERLCTRVGSRESGAVTVSVHYFSEPKILFGVGRESFLPPPKVDSAVIQLSVRSAPPVAVADEKQFFALTHAAFAQRRKTFANSVSSVLPISKEKIIAALNSLSIDPAIRAERLTMEQLAELSELLRQG